MSGLFDLEKKVNNLIEKERQQQSVNNKNFRGGSGHLNQTKENTQHSDGKIDMEKYDEVPRAQWSSLLNCYIRYKLKDGSDIKQGGRVKSIVPEGSGFKIEILKFRNKKQPMKWYISTENVDKILKLKNDQYSHPDNTISVEPTTTPDTLLDQIGDKLLFGDNDMLQKKIDALEARLAKVETDLKGMFKLFKKMHEDFYKSR